MDNYPRTSVIASSLRSSRSIRPASPPAHEPGVLPSWLHDLGANVIITGGMGQRAQQLFAQNGIEVIVGVSCRPVEQVVNDYLQGSLQAGENICDH